MTDSTIIRKTSFQFHGGIHPPEFKSLSNQTASLGFPMPKILIVPLKQHAGKPSIACVSVADKVEKGQLIATVDGFISANKHSPVDGIIKAIEPHYCGHPSGQKQNAIVIEVASKDVGTLTTPHKHFAELNDWESLDRKTIIDRISHAGVVGLGGATFPTQVKLSSDKIERLIVNAMECEPYITCDDVLLREEASLVLTGAHIAANLVGCNHITFAIEDNKPKAIKALEKAITDYDKNNLKLEIVIAPTKYPSGGEKQVIELVTGQQLPTGQLPSSLGLLVQNTATLYAVYDAVINQNVLAQRLVTITGNLPNQTGNYWIPFGTKINDIMQHFEIDVADCRQVIIGGPLMGQKITNFEAPVTKATNCLIFNDSVAESKNWTHENAKFRDCIRCSNCESACPASLLPQQLYWHARSDEWEALEEQNLFDCIECGACAYVCPSEIPLVQFYRYAKSSIRHNKEKQAKSEKAKERFEFREMRIERAKAERALKHQKAAEARKKAAKDKKDDPAGKKEAIAQALERVKQKKAQQTEAFSNESDSNSDSNSNSDTNNVANGQKEN